MKLRFPLSRPAGADGTSLPALCAGGLASLAVLQLALTRPVEPPAPGWTGGAVRGQLPQVSLAAAPASLRQTTIFSPDRTMQAGEADPPSTPLGGYAVAGTVSIKGRRVAMIQTPQGGIVRLRIGGAVGGMRLAALGEDSALFIVEGKRVAVPFGGRVSRPAPAAYDGDPAGPAAGEDDQ